MRLFFVRSEAGEADILSASDEKAIDFGIGSGLSWGGCPFDAFGLRGAQEPHTVAIGSTPYESRSFNVTDFWPGFGARVARRGTFCFAREGFVELLQGGYDFA